MARFFGLEEKQRVMESGKKEVGVDNKAWCGAYPSTGGQGCR